MSVERIEVFSVKPESRWRASEMVKSLTKAKIGEKFREQYESEYARKSAQRGIRSYLYHRGIDVKTQGWETTAEFERLR